MARVVSAGTCIGEDPSKEMLVRLSHWPVGPEMVSNIPVGCGSDRLRMRLSVVWATSSRVPLVF